MKNTENENVTAFVKAVKIATNANTKASHRGAWAIAILLEDGEELDPAFCILKDALAGEAKLSPKDRSNALNGVRPWVPAAVSLREHHEECPPKNAWPSLKRVKAVIGDETPAEVTFSFAEKQSTLVDRAKESLAQAGHSNPTLANIEEQMIKLAPRKEGKVGTSPINMALTFVSTANVEELHLLSVAIATRQENIKKAQVKVGKK